MKRTGIKKMKSRMEEEREMKREQNEGEKEMNKN
jgi:hypothetical protein